MRSNPQLHQPPAQVYSQTKVNPDGWASLRDFIIRHFAVHQE